jgi:hypothetical protein
MQTSAEIRAAVDEQIRMLAGAGQQRSYEKDVPHAFVPAELIEVFVTDLYHPKASQFLDRNLT